MKKIIVIVVIALVFCAVIPVSAALMKASKNDVFLNVDETLNGDHDSESSDVNLPETPGDSETPEEPDPETPEKLEAPVIVSEEVDGNLFYRVNNYDADHFYWFYAWSEDGEKTIISSTYVDSRLTMAYLCEKLGEETVASNGGIMIFAKGFSDSVPREYSEYSEGVWIPYVIDPDSDVELTFTATLEEDPNRTVPKLTVLPDIAGVYYATTYVYAKTDAGNFELEIVDGVGLGSWDLYQESIDVANGKKIFAVVEIYGDEAHTELIATCTSNEVTWYYKA